MASTSDPQPSQSRSRGCRRRCETALSCVVALSCLATVSGFAPSSLTSARSLLELNAVRSAGVQQVKPRTVSSKDRQRAVEAMEQQQANEAAAVVDARMLEMLSDNFLYPSKNKSKPRGRPEMVPGAMKYETLLTYRKKAEAARGGNVETPTAYVDMGAVNTNPPKRGRGRPKKTDGPTTTTTRTNTRKGVKGGRTSNGDSKPRAASVEQSTQSKRKRVVKNLPKRRSRKQEPEPELPAFRRRQSVASDLQRYYRTELLTAKEEYSLGTKVQFMVKCEAVHEGLAIGLERLPTIEEWAHACGFTDADPEFFERAAYADIRPAGCEDMFLVKDPNMFIGNGLACELGVGRGRGRAKKTPPSELKPFYDDTEKKFRQYGDPEVSAVLMNEGTPTNFVDRLLDSKAAKQRMVSSNMRLVLSISRKYSNVGVNLQDLVQEGSLGLSRAAEKFEPKKGFKFSTYASWWIQQAVFRSIAYHSRTIRLPVHVHNLLNKIRKIRKTTEQELGRPPTNEEMAKQLEMPLAKYNKMMRLTRRSISLETPKYKQNPKDFGHEGSDLLGDTIDAQILPDETRPEKGVDRKLFHEDLRQMLSILEDDERRVISARYGLDDGLTRTVTAVAAGMKMPKAWVRSKECRALRKLRRPWYEKRLKEHQNSLTS